MPNNDDYPIPQSNALRQVDRRSLQELFSIDPENLGESLWDVVAHMQDLRERLAATETVRQVRVQKAKGEMQQAANRIAIRTVANAAQLGLVKKVVQ
jgi:hypothetical protein